MIYPETKMTERHIDRATKVLKETPCENDDGYILYIKSLLTHGKSLETLAGSDKFHLLYFTDAHTYLVTENLRLKFTEEEQSYIHTALQRCMNMMKAFKIINNPTDGPMYFEELKEVERQVVYRIQQVVEDPYGFIPLEVQKSISNEDLFLTEICKDLSYLALIGDQI